jgi:regulator of protease activity HflC (stomatin/prohibitin superfamily)
MPRSFPCRRSFFSAANDDYSRGGYREEWPLESSNTILNIVPQGTRVVVERFGKFHAVKTPGFFFAIPIVDRLAYVVDMREKAIAIAPQPAITKDNVSVDVSGNVYTRFTDPYNAAYGSFDPLYAVYQHAQASMRAAIGKLDLDDILHARAQLNTDVTNTLQDAATPWGLEILRYEITEIAPDREIQIAMDKQAVAERDRREQVLSAEGHKRAAVLESEGIKLRKQNESEGELIKVRNEAQAAKERTVLQAEGDAEAQTLRAEAEARAIRIVAAAIAEGDGIKAAQLDVARQYIDMYGQLSGKSNTMLFTERPGDVPSLIAQAAAVLSGTPKAA